MTDAQTLLQEGLSAFRARAYDQALQAWRALLEIEPHNQQVLQLVERTEALATEGHLVHSLKEELADLREELASTRQARNDLLMEMARVHKRYQAREARLWRLQEEREWELRDALARAELSSFATSPKEDADAAPSDPSSLNPEHELTKNALQEAHAHIQRLRKSLDEAHERISALEEHADHTHLEHHDLHHADPSAHPSASEETIKETVDKDITGDTQEDQPADTIPSAVDPFIPEISPSGDPAQESTRASENIAPHASSEPQETPAAKRSDTAANPHTHDDGEDARRSSHTRPSHAIADDGEEPSRKTPSPYRQPSPKHTQTSHTLAASRALYEQDESHEEDDEHSFAGPLIDDLWLQEDTQDIVAEPVPDELVHIVRQVNASPTETASPDALETSQEDTSGSTPDVSLASTLDEGHNQEDTDDPPATNEESLPSDSTSSGAPSTLGNGTPPLAPQDVSEDTLSRTSLPSKPNAPPAAPIAEKTAPESGRRNIPDTAKIDAEPMDDKNLADGFADELTSALGSTPAPARLFTGVQPELPDMDILEDEPEKMAPEDLDKFPTAIPVRNKINQELEDPIARYLLTHVDGVSTFMELRGTVGLPPAAVDRGFRILLAHDVIRVQHQS